MRRAKAEEQLVQMRLAMQKTIDEQSLQSKRFDEKASVAIAQMQPRCKPCGQQLIYEVQYRLLQGSLKCETSLLVWLQAAAERDLHAQLKEAHLAQGRHEAGRCMRHATYQCSSHHIVNNSHDFSFVKCWRRDACISCAHEQGRSSAAA